jgi:hypothetical protein
MAVFAFMVSGLAFLGALACWIAGAWFYARTLRTLAPAAAQHSWLTIAAWPFGTARLKGAAGEHASHVNKTLVALLACLMVGFAATSVATNLARVSR